MPLASIRRQEVSMAPFSCEAASLCHKLDKPSTVVWAPLRPCCSDTANRRSVVQLQTLQTLELDPFLEHPKIPKMTPCHTPTPRFQTPSALLRRSSSASACDLLGSDGHPLNYGSYEPASGEVLNHFVVLLGGGERFSAFRLNLPLRRGQHIAS